MPQKSSTSIGFRLSGDQAAALTAKVGATGLSVHECARNLVIAGLAPKPETTTSEVTELRRDLAVVLEALLIAGQILTPPEARRLVNEKLGF